MPRLAALASLLLLGAAAPREAALERGVLAEINAARADPQGYAERLRDYRGRFDGKVVRYPGNPTGLRTAEGRKAVDDAIDFLEDQPALPPLTASPLLGLAARDHVDEQGPRGATGHRSAKGERADARVRRRGGGGVVGEVITYGPPSAAEVVRQLIVDDGVRDRGHRHALYDRGFRFAGAGCGPHKGYRVMCVVVLGRTADGR